MEALVDDSLGLLLASGKETEFHHIYDRREADLALDRSRDLLLQSIEIVASAGFDINSHTVLPVQMRDADLALQNAFRNLGEREKQILSLRFYDGKTQMEVASTLGISQAQVSRLEKGAIGAMRKSVSVS